MSADAAGSASCSHALAFRGRGACKLTDDDGARSDADDDAHDVQASAITRSKALPENQRADRWKEPTSWSVRIERPVFP